MSRRILNLPLEEKVEIYWDLYCDLAKTLQSGYVIERCHLCTFPMTFSKEIHNTNLDRGVNFFCPLCSPEAYKFYRDCTTK